MKARNVPSIVSYESVSKPDNAAVSAAFDFLFKKTIHEFQKTRRSKDNILNANNIKGGDAKL